MPRSHWERKERKREGGREEQSRGGENTVRAAGPTKGADNGVQRPQHDRASSCAREPGGLTVGSGLFGPNRRHPRSLMLNLSDLM